MNSRVLILTTIFFILVHPSGATASPDMNAPAEYAQCVVTNDIERAERLLNHIGSQKAFGKIVRKTESCKSAKPVSKSMSARIKGEIARAIVSTDQAAQTAIAQLPSKKIQIQMGFGAAKSQQEFELMIIKHSKCLVDSKPQASLEYVLATSDSASKILGKTFVDCIPNPELLKLPINVSQHYVARELIARVRSQ